MESIADYLERHSRRDYALIITRKGSGVWYARIKDVNDSKKHTESLYAQGTTVMSALIALNEKVRSKL